MGAIGYRSIKSILEKHLERMEALEPEAVAPPIMHGNIRGRGYYGGGAGGGR